jgi:hypothetical protein
MNEQIGHRYTREGQRIQQHYIPPQQAASRHRVGHSAGLHPEDTPYLTGQQLSDDTEEDEYDDEWPARLPTSARRYQRMPEVTTRHGRVNVVQHYHQQPLRAQRQHDQQFPPQHSSLDEEAEPKAQRRLHWLVWVGAFLMLLALGWLALNSVSSWWQGVQTDWAYGKDTRTYQTNAVVGHADSSSSPSHFIGINLRGPITVIEFPGGDAAKARSYQITTIPGNDGNPPVKLVFQDLNRDGKLDMLVQIGDPGSIVSIMLFNNGSQFVPHV